eukprot:1531860-Rhodomonas_salina.4
MSHFPPTSEVTVFERLGPGLHGSAPTLAPLLRGVEPAAQPVMSRVCDVQPSATKRQTHLDPRKNTDTQRDTS